MMFRDQVGVLAGWFKSWNECEQTVALLSLLKRVNRSQARFLQICLEHSLADCTELHILENEANSPGKRLRGSLSSLLLSHLPTLFRASSGAFGPPRCFLVNGRKGGGTFVGGKGPCGCRSGITPDCAASCL